MKTATAILAFAASATAHMIMEFPKPYGAQLPNTSPLEDSGVDFPCKATGPESYVVSAQNTWAAGETQQVRFKGSAVHGGGSCQFSLTTDQAPTKDSQWKVIHSVIGGCPSSESKGNLPDNPNNKNNLSTYPVTLPADLPSGQYTFAWTWFNKIGNREMYMNCAPVTVTGASGSADVSSVLGSLPDMFVANLPRAQCSIAEGQDFEFPNPGDSVTRGPGAETGNKFANTAGCAAMNLLGAGNGQLGTPSQPTGAPAPPVEQPSASPTAAPTAVPSNPGGEFAPGASQAVSSPPVAAPTQAPVSPPVNPPTNPPPTNNTPSEGVPCDTDGAIICIGSTQFGVCNWGSALPMDLASGTTCANGVISGSPTKRSVRFPRAHLRRHHGSNM